MPHSPFTLPRKLLTAFCGILCLLFLTLWVLSYIRGMGLRREWDLTDSRPNPAAPGTSFYDRKDGQWDLRSDSGLLQFFHSEELATYDARAGARIVPRPLTVKWNPYSYSNTKPSRPENFDQHNFLGLSHYDPWGTMGLWMDDPAPLSKDVRGTVTTAPYWLLALLTAIPALLGARRWRRARHLARLGLCRHCGYDLRAHQPGERCPECGTVVPISSASAASPPPVTSALPADDPSRTPPP
jgi:hypothetical protein